MKSWMFVGVLMVVSVVSVQATVYNWTSTSDANWSSAGNWDQSAYPTEGSVPDLRSDVESVNISGSGGKVGVTGLAWLRLDTTTASAMPVVTISDGGSLTMSDALHIGSAASSKGKFVVDNGAYTLTGTQLDIGRNATGEGWFEIKNGGSVSMTAGDYFVVGTVGGIGHLKVSDSTLSVNNYLVLAEESGSKAYATISGNSTVTIPGRLVMNVESTTTSYSELVLNGGAINVGSYSFLGNSGGEAHITINGGTYTGSDRMDIVSQNRTASADVTINGGKLIINSSINLGKDNYGTDSGTSRLNINGGTVRCNALTWNMNDSLVVYTGGRLLLPASWITEAQLTAWVNNPDLFDVSGANGWRVTTVNDDGTDYTALVPPDGTLVVIK